MLYAYASAANNNGSAFAGLTVTSLVPGCARRGMLLGRFIPIISVLALAGSLAAQRKVAPESAGTLPTTGPLFVVLVWGTVVLVAALTFFPALALGPIAEALA